MGVWLLRFAGFCEYDDPFHVVINVAVGCRMVLWVQLDSDVEIEVEKELWAER